MHVSTHFQLCDDVNVQNCVYGAAWNPHQINGLPLHSWNLLVCCAFRWSAIFGPCFVEREHGKTVTLAAECYWRWFEMCSYCFKKWITNEIMVLTRQGYFSNVWFVYEFFTWQFCWVAHISVWRYDMVISFTWLLSIWLLLMRFPKKAVYVTKSLSIEKVVIYDFYSQQDSWSRGRSSIQCHEKLYNLFINA